LFSIAVVPSLFDEKKRNFFLKMSEFILSAKAHGKKNWFVSKDYL